MEKNDSVLMGLSRNDDKTFNLEIKGMNLDMLINILTDVIPAFEPSKEFLDWINEETNSPKV